MNKPTKSPNVNIPEDFSPCEKEVGRRRFLGAGSAITVLASLKSGSALAEGVCTSPSAFTSIALNPATSQRPPVNPLVCHSHGYWKNANNWPISKETKVKDVFCLSASTELIGITRTTTLIQVLNLGGGGLTPYARDLVSAYLDALYYGGSSPFTTLDIKKMWALVFCGGTYSVNGTAWNLSTVRAFLDKLVGP